MLWQPIPIEEIAGRVQDAIQAGYLGDDTPALVGYDLNRLKDRCRSLKGAFPKDTLHAVAVKANPLVRVLHELRAADMGAEVASAGELALARHTGFAPESVVLDSPVKTRLEIEDAVAWGVSINLDTLAELAVTDRIQSFTGSVGIRINPQIGTGSISYTSTAGTYSKFGVPLDEYREHLLDAYLTRPYLNAIHLHVGSQGCSPELLSEGVQKVLGFVADLHGRLGKDRIRQVDIGGGLPAQYHRDRPTFSVEDYAAALRERCPSLFTGQYRLVTEFGRVLHANLGWAISRVERVKRQKDRTTVMIHLGADMFVRECYCPDDWHHDLCVLDSTGRIKAGAREVVHVAGPLCFSGDIVARDVAVVTPEPGDYLLIADVGAYTFSMWSRYNSRPMPGIVGYDDRFAWLKQPESLEEVVRFWS